MLQTIIAGANMDDLVLDLDEFQQSLDMGPLAQEIAEFLEQDNTAARLEGVDIDGNPLAPIKEITRKTRRGNPDADPLVPNSTASRSIRDFTTEVSNASEDAYIITGLADDSVYQHSLYGYVSRAEMRFPPETSSGFARPRETGLSRCSAIGRPERFEETDAQPTSQSSDRPSRQGPARGYQDPSGEPCSEGGQMLANWRWQRN